MKRNLNKCLVYFFVILLSACTGNFVREDSGGINKSATVLDVDSGVVKDFNHAVSLMQTGDYELAVTVLKTVVEREKRLPAPFVNLGMAYNKLDEKQLAEDNFIIAQ